MRVNVTTRMDWGLSGRAGKKVFQTITGISVLPHLYIFRYSLHLRVNTHKLVQLIQFHDLSKSIL